jgi:hypothetical protein
MPRTPGRKGIPGATASRARLLRPVLRGSRKFRGRSPSSTCVPGARRSRLGLALTRRLSSSVDRNA